MEIQEFTSRWGEHKGIIAYYLIAERFSVGHFPPGTKASSKFVKGIVTAAREAVGLFQQAAKPLARAQGPPSRAVRTSGAEAI